MKLVFLIFILSAPLVTFASGSKSVKTFKNYLKQARKEYSKTQRSLINGGDSFLKRHTVSAEKLSLAEMLPLSRRELASFCRGYSGKILKYYNVDNPAQLRALKSSVFTEYNKMVALQCRDFQIKSKK